MKRSGRPPGHENAKTKRPPHTAGETGAFLKYSIGQQRVQSMSQSAAKSSAKLANRQLRASLHVRVFRPPPGAPVRLISEPRAKIFAPPEIVRPAGASR